MPDNAQEPTNLHADAVIEFDEIISVVKDEREQSLQDRRFYSIAGAQWEGRLGEQFENKPKFEVNKVHLAVIRIINEYRNNRITVDFTSRDGTENDKLADACDGLYRADEQDSVADEAYDNAFEEGVGGGFGAWRYRAEYEDEYDDENERQRIRIEPIYDADSCVYFDLGAKRQDKSDAKRCFVLTGMSKRDYKDEYDDDPASWPKDIAQGEFDWTNGDVVFVAELYVVEIKSHVVHVYKTLDDKEERYTDAQFENEPELYNHLVAVGSTEVRKKKVKRKRVHKYKMSGSKILEDCGYIAGPNIPIVPYYGKRWVVDGIERCIGHVRLPKDAQRLKNMQVSKLAEISALSSVEKPIFTPEQIAGHQGMWEDDNIKDYPYMLVNPIVDKEGNLAPVGPVGYTKPPMIPPALAALLQITDVDIKELLGNQEAGEEIQANISGKAVELVQNRLDMQTFIYLSNLKKSTRRGGEIWLGMAKELLVEKGRNMKTVGPQDEISTIELNKPYTDDDGETQYENDLRNANFDLTVDVGPSSASKRAATVRTIMGMMQITTDPETLQVLGAMAMMNMEGEGIEDVRGFFRKKLLKMGVVEPTKTEAEELLQVQEAEPPDANTEYLNAAADEAGANAAKARTDTILTLAKSEETEAKKDKVIAETIETLAGIPIDATEAAIETIEQLPGSGEDGKGDAS